MKRSSVIYCHLFFIASFYLFISIIDNHFFLFFAAFFNHFLSLICFQFCNLKICSQGNILMTLVCRYVYFIFSYIYLIILLYVSFL